MLQEKLNSILAAKKPFMSDRINLVGFGLALLINLIHPLVLYAKIKPGASQVLLHYNVVYGLSLVEKSLYIYWIPLLALIMLAINAILAAQFYQKEKLAAYFLAIASIVVELVFFVATLTLIIANE